MFRLEIYWFPINRNSLWSFRFPCYVYTVIYKFIAFELALRSLLVLDLVCHILYIKDGGLDTVKINIKLKQNFKKIQTLLNLQINDKGQTIMEWIISSKKLSRQFLITATFVLFRHLFPRNLPDLCTISDINSARSGVIYFCNFQPLKSEMLFKYEIVFRENNFNITHSATN